jgi:pimeloyl-ACP methyl ester carboxylesterase
MLTRRKFSGYLTAAIAFLKVPEPFGAYAKSSEPMERSLFVRIGGIDQWISIRGQSPNNPVLLVVHGGPGEAQSLFADHYRAWEQKFTVVQWDQRGAGHTYGRYRDRTTSMNSAQIAADGAELVEYLCRTLGKEKICLLGHSWGSIIGVNIAMRCPEKIAAYVGTGQVASWTGAIQAKFDFLMSKAVAVGDAGLISQLEASGPPDPKNSEEVFAFNEKIYLFWPEADVAWVKYLRSSAPATRAAAPKDFNDFEDGFRFSARTLVSSQMMTDLPATASILKTAFILVQGEDDIVTPTSEARRYFEGVDAPYKELILIPDAGHFALLTAQQAFCSALSDSVRPIAVARGA